MSLSFLLETGVRLSAWTLYQSFNGIHYLIYGSPTDPNTAKLKNIEDKLAKLDSKNNIQINSQHIKNIQHYWNIKSISNFTSGNWIILNKCNIISQESDKSTALQKIIFLINDITEKEIYTLIQVDNESSDNLICI